MLRAFGMEPEFTNYTRNFKGTLDYIWSPLPPSSLSLSLMPGRYTPSRLKMLAVSTPPTAEDVASHCEGLPSVQYPSDHIYLCCDASLNLNGGGGGNNGGGGMSLSAMALRHQLGHKPGLGNPRMAQQQSGRR
jgi:hypothetical protein